MVWNALKIVSKADICSYTPLLRHYIESSRQMRFVGAASVPVIILFLVAARISQYFIYRVKKEGGYISQHSGSKQPVPAVNYSAFEDVESFANN